MEGLITSTLRFKLGFERMDLQRDAEKQTEPVVCLLFLPYQCGSSRSEPVYKISGSDLDSPLDHVH